MLKGYEKMELPDKSKHRNVKFEVNWNEDVNDCKAVRVTIDGKSAVIDTKYLNSFLFMIGDPESQKKMIPQKTKNVRHFSKVVTIEATKDIPKGQKIHIPVEISVPSEEEFIISSLKKKHDKGQDIFSKKTSSAPKEKGQNK